MYTYTFNLVDGFAIDEYGKAVSLEFEPPMGKVGIRCEDLTRNHTAYDLDNPLYLSDRDDDDDYEEDDDDDDEDDYEEEDDQALDIYRLA